MKPEDIVNAEKAATIIEERQLEHVKIGIFDVDGVMRGKFMSKDKFASALKNGFGFCDVILGWDVNDQLYDNASMTGWHTGYPDSMVRISLDTCRSIPFDFQGKGLLFIAEFEGDTQAICPRSILRRVISKANEMGFIP